MVNIIDDELLYEIQQSVYTTPALDFNNFLPHISSLKDLWKKLKANEPRTSHPSPKQFFKPHRNWRGREQGRR